MTMRSPGSVLPLFYGASPKSMLAFRGSPSTAVPFSAKESSQQRNLFGPAKPGEIYVGQGTSWDQQIATRKMLEALVVHMKLCPWPLPEDNPNIPAGYTYLAQLAAHDLVNNIAPLPRLDDRPGYFARDYRTDRLVLDTIYGGGPVTTHLPFAINGHPRNPRHSLRLGYVLPSEQSPRPSPMTDQPARDIGRVACPFLTDAPGVGVPDPLLADPRNDDHLIISQLTALLHELHNIIYARLAAADAGLPASTDEFQTYRRFLEARKITALVYRKVIIDDLLSKLLEPHVYAYYAADTTRYPHDFLDQCDDGRVPVEFSHAAYRFGHVMARFTYSINDRLGETATIKEILDRTSSRRPDKLPLACAWLIDWLRFFPGAGQQSVNYSRRITPFVAGGPLAAKSHFPNEDAADGGLFYRDLIRGADAGVRTVASLIEHLRPEHLAHPGPGSELLRDPGYREHVVGEWLRTSSSSSLPGPDAVALSQNPPLFFFVLFEAAHSQNGERLGILGSTIVAEVFFAAYKKSRPVIEEDATLWPRLAQVFPGDIPGDMPAVIDFIQSNGGLKPVACPGP
jgi:hypothetical protein